MLEELNDYVRTLELPADDRLPAIDRVATAILAAPSRDLIFVCTHNSRRSQLCEVWAKAFSSLEGLDLSIKSAGTEETAFNIRMIDALRRCGMEIESTSDIDLNPHYLIRYALNRSRQDCWSKTLDDPAIDLSDAVVVMTCDDADQNCPHIPEASERIPLRYSDPKAYDDTPAEVSAYDDTCRLVASEMKYLVDSMLRLRK